MNEFPVISVVIPVYNAAQYLGRILDSLICQSIEVCYEIICVNGGSSDNSWEILSEYQNNYPDKIHIYDINKKYCTSPEKRNYGIQKARGKYVYICDSDDAVQIKALELLYKEAEEYNCDLVAANTYQVTTSADGGIIECRLSENRPTKSITNEEAILGQVQFWAHLIKKSLIEKVGLMENNLRFDDVSYMVKIKSFARNIRYIDVPIYYYFKRKDSVSGSLNKEVCMESVAAEKYILENCNPKYRYAVKKMVCNRISSNCSYRWICSDIFIEWAKEIWCSTENSALITQDAYLNKRMSWMANLSFFDPIVYVNGFECLPSKMRIEELKIKAFHTDCKVVVLSTENCNMEENPYISQAYVNGDYELVGGYFALKNIYENGGIYIHDKVRVVNYFNDCRYLGSFFAFIDRENFSDKIFGGKPENPVIKSILNTYSFSWDKKGEFMPLAERIKIILTAKYDVPLNGQRVMTTAPVHVFSAENMVVNVSFGDQCKKCFCEHDYSDAIGDNEYVTVKRSTLDLLLNSPIAENAPVDGAFARSNTGLASVSAIVNSEKALRKELNDIKNSDTYKAAMRIKKFANTKLGKPFKKMFKWFLKKYRKHKYGIS